MKRFIGLLDGKNVAIEGDNWDKAMLNSGLIVETKYTSGKNYVGKLVDGKRYSISFQVRKDCYSFLNPTETLPRTELNEMLLKRSRKAPYSRRKARKD